MIIRLEYFLKTVRRPVLGNESRDIYRGQKMYSILGHDDKFSFYF